MSLPAASARIQSVDILRGIVMVLMALDHVRDFFAITPFDPVSVAETTPGWFFTRWITHFCAPVFVMLAGVGAYLYGTKVSKAELRNFLLTRGLWLIIIEITVVNFIIKFDFSFLFLQVIWTIGVCMIFLAGLMYLPRWALMVFTFVLIAGHNLLDGIHLDAFGWKLLHEQYFGFPVAVIYPLIPWPAVMTLGFLLGPLFQKSERQRTKELLVWGGMFVLAFVAIRAINVYGDPHAWTVSDRGAVFTFLDFLNTTKYPPSLLYILMTIGPALLLLPVLEKAGSKVGALFINFGRVPFFYYILHFFIIHVLAVVYNGLVYGVWGTWIFEGWPETYVPSLVTCYIVWVIIVGIMYFLCKWFVSIKKTNTAWWLKYL